MANVSAGAPGATTTELSYRNGVLLVLLAGAFWSTMGLGIRQIADANVWQILVYRSIALSVFLFCVIAWRSRGRPFERIRKAGLAGVVGAWGLVLAFAGGVFAIQTTTVANAMFLFAAAPFLAALLGWLILKEDVRPSTWIAMVLAIAGISVMVAEGFSTGRMIGNMAAIASATGFAIFTVALRWGKLGDMMPAVFLGGVFAALTAFVICRINGYTLMLTLNDASIAIGMGLLQVGAGLTVYTIGSRVVPAAELALLSMTEVVLGPFWVWLFLGETFGLYTLIGGIVLMVAVAYNALSGLRRKPVHPV